MWRDEKEELKANIISGIKYGLMYVIAWALMMVPVIKAFM